MMLANDARDNGNRQQNQYLSNDARKTTRGNDAHSLQTKAGSDKETTKVKIRE